MTRTARMIAVTTLLGALLLATMATGWGASATASAKRGTVPPGLTEINPRSPSSVARETVEDNRSGAAPRPLLFSDDFEAYGDFSRWGATDAPLLTIVENPVSSGRYAARARSSGDTPAYVRKQLGAAWRDVFFRLRFNVVDQGENPVTLLHLMTPGGEPVLRLVVGQTGLLGYLNEAADLQTESDIIVSHGRWHEVQIGARVEGADGRIDVWYDGVHVDALSSTAWLGDGAIGRIDLGENTTGRIYDVVFDDIAVDTDVIPSSRGADPIPGKLTVRAIPAWSGLSFQIDGRTFVTDDRGIARIDVERWSTDLRQRITGLESQRPDGVHAVFGGWHSWTGVRDHDVVATFNLSHQVRFHFVDLQGATVDPNLVSSLTLKSSTGVVNTFKADQLGRAQMLQTSAVAPAPKGRSNKPLSYTVESVVVNGANVVHRSQQHFLPDEQRDLTIKLLFYAIRFESRDAFFGFPVGLAVRIEYPDGSIHDAPLDRDGKVTADRLPRGDYRVSVTGPGFSPPRPISLSRGQVVQLDVISDLDMALAFACFVLVAAGLLLLGRPALLHFLLRLARSAKSLRMPRTEQGSAP